MDENAWLTEFVVTPHIKHAIQVLREAIPRRGDIPEGSEAIAIERKFGVLTAMSARVELPEIDPHESLSHQEITLTAAQWAAAELLLATLTYYDFLIEQAYAPPNDEEMRAYLNANDADGCVPPSRMKAKDDLNRHLLDTLRLSTDCLNPASEHSVIIWS